MAELSDILGNERIKEHFNAALLHEKISHAYIIEGEKGSGKKLFASAFSKILQCEHRTAETFQSGNRTGSRSGERIGKVHACGKCESCIQMEHKDHPDVIWVTHEKPSVISVGEIRTQVVNTIGIKPYKGPYKIYIIDEAEKMNPAAQNAILKTIEEPPEYAVIFLLTNSRGAFLDTILSRCILLALKPVAVGEIRNYLTEKCGVTEEEAEFGAKVSLGNIGRAVLFVSSEEFQELKNAALSLLKEIHETEIYEIAEKVKEYKNYKNRIDDFLDVFLMWFRDVLLIRACDFPGGNPGRNPGRDDLGRENVRENVRENLIFRNEYGYLKKQADRLNLESIDYIMERIRRTRDRIRANVNFDASLELLIMEIRREFQ